MAYTYNWQITGLKKQNTDSVNGVIIGTHWKLTATDSDGNEGTFSGATPFTLSQVDYDNFIAYEDLEEQHVIGWVKAVVTGSHGYWDHISGVIEAEVSKSKFEHKEVLNLDLPWSTGSVTPSAADLAALNGEGGLNQTPIPSNL